MNDLDFRKNIFYRTFMTAVFVGIITTLLAMAYDLLFVRTFNFPLSAIINVSSLIFGINLAFLVVGLLYYVFQVSFKKGDLYYIITLVLTTALLAWRAELANRSADEVVNHQFRNLLAGIVIIMGVMAGFVLPFLYHTKRFEDAVL